ncbi:very-long-chain 3-oxoacyl-CoA reductase-like [Babylonia areolata]|uniref:very-long-chain 3-oxoacyl-CoA reductase-like n=1 Tax=Babylonia areolata TaxID=304850 RepID=UPI003FD17B99
MDIVLISRNPQKLSAVAEQIVQQFQVSVKVITADFKKTDIYDNIKQQLTGLDIGVLVNNVGMGTPLNYLCEIDDFEQLYRDVVNVNVLSAVMMTGIVLPDMVQRKRGAIINVSSAAGLRPAPFITVYSATKVFLRYFSEALNMEYSPQGVTIQVVCPTFVETNMTSGATGSWNCIERWFYPTSDVYVTAALGTLGREPCTPAYWRHELWIYGYLMMSESSVKSFLLGLRNKVAQRHKED